MSRIKLVYEQIVAHFLNQIRTNKLKGGDRLMSEAECMKYFDVSRGTVRKVYALMIENGYARSVKGKGTFLAENVLAVAERGEDSLLENVASKRIAFVASGTTGFYQPLYEGVLKNIERNGWEMVPFYNTTVESERKCIRSILTRKDIDGMIILPVRTKDEWRADFYSAVSHRKIPIIVIGKSPHGMLTSSVSVDDGITVHSMVGIFHELHCRSVVLLHESKEGGISFSNRMGAYYVAMSRYYPTTAVNVIDVDREDWTEAAEKVIAESKSKLGFILFNGSNILPLFEVVKRSGKKLIDDVSVICYGPERSYSFLDRTLSIMEIPKFELGLRAVEMLFDEIANESRGYATNIVYPAKYLKGETS